MTLSRFRSAAVCAMVLLAAACSRNDPASFLSSAQSYMQKADYKAAIVQLKNAIQAAPENAEARYLLAKALLETGDPVGAETEVRKALDLEYSPELAYPLLARALYAEGKFQGIVNEIGAVKLETTQGRAVAALTRFWRRCRETSGRLS